MVHSLLGMSYLVLILAALDFVLTGIQRLYTHELSVLRCGRRYWTLRLLSLRAINAKELERYLN